MGFGNYSHDAHEALTRGRADLPTQAVFKQRGCHALMNPLGVGKRESRDSPDHPRSLAIAFALDVTGSMGAIPDLLARRELPKFMRVLLGCGVADPQLLFLAVGDATCDGAPLQVGQFESTAELMDQWLTWTFLEGGGGGAMQESYELALYFLAQHTAIDCFEKRGKRGYAFLTGDEHPYPSVARSQVETLIGDRMDRDVPTDAVVAKAEETWEPFFLVPDRERAKRCDRAWRDLLGDRVIVMETPEDTCFVAAGAVALGEGVVPDVVALAEVLASAGASPDRVRSTIRALTPFASTLGRDAAPKPNLSRAASALGSGMRRT